MSDTRPSDPPPGRDIHPTVGRVSRRAMPLPALAIAVLAVGIVLFAVLRSHQARVDATGDFGAADVGSSSSNAPPALRLPPAPAPEALSPAISPPLLRPTVRAEDARPAIIAAPLATPLPGPSVSGQNGDATQVFLPNRSTGSGRTTNASDLALVVDTTQADATLPVSGIDPGVAAPPGRASRLRNRATLIVAGTLIPAVLESGLDSSQAGFARAIVSQDVTGFDGSKLLVPQGSRLIGEYRSDLVPGQRRVLLSWTRLIRPDGVSVTLAGPATDAMGRAGVPGQVNSHFLERFGDAILRSVLDIGVNVASSRIGNSPVIVGVPGNVGSSIGQAAGRQIAPPTITVRPGAIVSVFVNRDLDFNRVEGRR